MHLFVLAIGFGLVTSSFLVLGAVGLTLQFAVTNYVNFAYGAILTLGAYVCATLTSRIGFWPAAAITLVSIAVLSVATGAFIASWFVNRNVPKYLLLLVTFSIALIIENGIELLWGSEPQQLQINVGVATQVGPFLLTTAQVAIIALTVVVVVALYSLLQYTSLGKKMRAVADSPLLAETSGVNANAVIIQTWMVTGLLAGLASVVLAVDELTFGATVGDTVVFLLFSAVIAGGLGHPYGTMLGAVIVGMVTEVSGVFIGAEYKTDVALAVLIVALLVRPQGIIPAKLRS